MVAASLVLLTVGLWLVWKGWRLRHLPTSFWGIIALHWALTATMFRHIQLLYTLVDLHRLRCAIIADAAPPGPAASAGSPASPPSRYASTAWEAGHEPLVEGAAEYSSRARSTGD